MTIEITKIDAARRALAVTAELLAAAEVAKILSCSPRHVWALNSSGRLPRPIRLGRVTRWRADEIRDWLAAGAPARDRWESLQRSS
jgi:predicted DNA-binding transcriptional regulator AlpA